jgi:hypothetical protein
MLVFAGVHRMMSAVTVAAIRDKLQTRFSIVALVQEALKLVHPTPYICMWCLSVCVSACYPPLSPRCW